METADIQAGIVDANGRVLKIFALRRDLAPGIFQEAADVRDLRPGVYFVQIRADGAGAPLTGKFLKN